MATGEDLCEHQCRRMHQIIASTARQYLIESGRIAASRRVCVTRLPGGVSNEVLLVEVDGDPISRFVLKQARPQLRTPQAWFCTTERIWREVAALQVCRSLAPPGQVPDVLFQDRPNYLYAMTAAPPGHRVWRDELLAGRFDAAIAQSAGRLLAGFHAGAWHDGAVAAALADREIFRQLRIEPYYETVARAFPEHQPDFARLIESLWQNACSLVHADFSPKNLLVHDGNLMLVDYETGHYGDPAFDLGFFLAHLVLKSFHHAPRYQPMFDLVNEFWAAYEPIVSPKIGSEQYELLLARAAANLAGCLWARLDGKSRIDYLGDESRRAAVRELARGILVSPPVGWSEALRRIEAALAAP
jgi:5-methylthioribose kinase